MLRAKRAEPNVTDIWLRCPVERGTVLRTMEGREWKAPLKKRVETETDWPSVTEQSPAPYLWTCGPGVRCCDMVCTNSTSLWQKPELGLLSLLFPRMGSRLNAGLHSRASGESVYVCVGVSLGPSSRVFVRPRKALSIKGKAEE